MGDGKLSYHQNCGTGDAAQIGTRKGETWVASGDYKTVSDGVSEPFEPVPCHAFITECTFGLPVFKWTPQDILTDQINTWWATNKAEGRFSLLSAYALGKAQRLLNYVDADIGPILTHAAIENTNEILRAQGIALPNTIRVTPDTNLKNYPGALVLATPGALSQPWANRFKPAATAFASGWMAVRGIRRRRAMDRGFIVSDHADWNGLISAINATGAERIFVTHGYTGPFERFLRERGYDAHTVSTEYAGEGTEDE